MTNSTKKDTTKATETKVEATTPEAGETTATEAKPRRKARTLEEKIAELQAQAKERAEKKEVSARKKFDELVEQYDKAEARVADLRVKLIETRGGYDFELPYDVVPTREEVEALQVKAQTEEAEAVAADEAALDSETDAA